MIERRQAISGMDQDSSPDFVQPGDYLVAMNARPGRERTGDSGSIKPLPGTTLRHTEETLGNVTIGSITDESKGRVYFFNWNSNKLLDRIWCWDRKTFTSKLMIAGSNVDGGLLFDRERPITGVALIGDYLYWTDGFVEPRVLNVERAIRTIDAGYVSPDGTVPEPYTYPLNKWDISAVRKAPLVPPTAEKIDSATDPGTSARLFNFINENSFMFSYRYVYLSGEQSVLAPYSPLIDHNRFQTTEGAFGPNTDNETFDGVRVEIPLSEEIGPEVQAVEFLVRNGNSGPWSIVKEFNREEDGAAMDAHDAGTAELGFYFFNDAAKIPVADEESYIPFYDVPLRSQALEVASNLLLMGNNTKGYDFAKGITLSLSETTESIDFSLVTPSNEPFYKFDSKYRFGVVFYDYAGRNAGVMPATVDFETPERTEIYPGTAISGVQWTLPSGTNLNIPEHAHYYSVVRTKNLNFQYFMEAVSQIRYGDAEDDGSYTFRAGAATGAAVVGFRLSFLTELGIGYTFSEGDLVKLIGSVDNAVHRFEIIGVQGEYAYASVIDIGNTADQGFLMTIYRPVLGNIEDTYHEVSEVFPVTNPGTFFRELSVVSGTVRGDIYYGSTSIDVPIEMMNKDRRNWELWHTDAGRPNQVLRSKQRTYPTEIAWGGAFFPGTDTNQLGAFLSGDVKLLDSEVGPIRKMKLTSRVQEYGTVLLVVGETEVASVYLGRNEFFDADGVQSLVTSTNVVGTVNVLRGGYGTVNPESFAENDGNAYWFSAIKSAWVRYSRAGVEPISDRKMSTFAAWLGNAVLSSEDRLIVPGGFDEYRQEYLCGIPVIGDFPIDYGTLDIGEVIAPLTGELTFQVAAGWILEFNFESDTVADLDVTVNDMFFESQTYSETGDSITFKFVARVTTIITIAVASSPPLSEQDYTFTLTRLRPDPYDAVNLFPKTIVFSADSGRASYFSNITPDWFGTVGDQLLSFKRGLLYTHDNAIPNFFYFINWPAWISMVFNSPPNLMKLPESVSVESTKQPNYMHVRHEEPFVQSTDSISTEFETKEGIHYATVKRDYFSPNTAGTGVEKMLKGDLMRSRWTKVLLEWNNGVNFVAKLFNLNSRPSKGHKT